MDKHWKEWCRLCAREDSNNTHIKMPVEGEEVPVFVDIINKCFSLNINPHDNWPRKICVKCNEFVANIISFTHRISKVQALFAELLNSQEELDPDQLKLQYELFELDNFEMDVKLFSQSQTSNHLEKNISAETSEQLVDLEELEYIDEEILNSGNIKTESNADYEEDGIEHLSSFNEDSDKCPKSELDSDDLEEETPKRRGRPRKSKHSKDLDTFACNECSKSFTRFSNYSHHMLEEHNNSVDSPQFSCTSCEKKFLSEKRLQNHIVCHHSSDEKSKTQFSCTTCDKKFMSEKRLQNHAVCHLPLDQKLKIPCPFCDKKFTRSEVVQGHIRTVHMGEKPFVCEECGKACTTFGSLKDHQFTHTEERPFKCRWCDKRFKNKSRLKTHEDTHNHTNYVCTTCGLQLNTRRTLKMHMVVHSDQKQHKCDFCGNEYKRAKALKSHLILHTGLKPYTCNFCDKTFANGSNCRSHKKKAHPVELAAMEAAGKKIVNTNVPKLEQLRAVTSNKAAIVSSCDLQDYGENVSILSMPDDESLREGSLIEEPILHKESELVHAVFVTMPES